MINYQLLRSKHHFVYSYINGQSTKED